MGKGQEDGARSASVWLGAKTATETDMTAALPDLPAKGFRAQWDDQPIRDGGPGQEARMAAALPGQQSTDGRRTSGQ